MKVIAHVYADNVIAVALVQPSLESELTSLALRWLAPTSYTNIRGTVVQTTNHMGGETDWFVLPHTFAAAIGRTLVQQRAAGLQGFLDEGYAQLTRWLVDDEELPDSMCY